MSGNSNNIPSGPGRKLKIALSIWMFKSGTGGLQSHAEQLARALQQRGHEVVVVTRAYRKVPEFLDFLFYNEPLGEAEVNGVRVRPLCLNPRWKPLQWLVAKCIHRPALQRLGIKLYQWLARRPARRAFAGFDLIHHVGQATAMIGFAAEEAARHHGVPFLVQPTCHPFQTGDDLLDHQLFEHANRLLVHTHFEAGHFSSRQPLLPIDVVGNGIEDRANGDANRFRAEYKITGPIILYLGRKEPDKGYPLVLEAFQKIQPQHSNATLVCLGPRCGIPPPTGIPALLDLDYMPEQAKHDALAACTFLCVPSVGESFGLVFMEAGRYRKPIIARRLPVLEELFGTNNQVMLLGRPEPAFNRVHVDSKELAAAMEQLLKDEALCRRMGDACLRVSEKFLWPKVVKNFESAYYRALAERTRS
jgi:glycosyltransferase involved in cell wall biosynthesis